MIKIPYRFLIVAVAAAATLAMLAATVGGSPPEAELGGGELIVVERMREGAIYFHNTPYVFSDSTALLGDLRREEIRVGDWLLVTMPEGEAGRHRTLLTIERAPADTVELTGTIGSLLLEPVEGEDGAQQARPIGFTINNLSIYYPPGVDPFEGHAGGHNEPAVGLGVKVKARIEREGGGGSERLLLRARIDDEGWFQTIRSHNLLHAITMLMLQIAVILLVAKVGGELFERFLGQPGVLGELIGGVIISPYALGGMISIPGVGALFETVRLSDILAASPIQPDFAVTPELWAIAQMAAIVLLFMAGLETDLKQFLRYAGPATAVAMGGVITPFFLGALATWWFVPGIESMWDPTALFMGAVMVATSVGITARVLSDINRLDTSEGVTILAGAVIDDVLGILVLAIVNAIAVVELMGGTLDVETIIGIAVKAVLFWLGLTGIGILASRQVERFLVWFKTKGATFGLGLALAFACAATAELFGLAMIIGAYSIGLAMSNTKVSYFLEESLASVYNFVVPIFFVVMGMMVDFRQMLPLLWPYGVVISFFAVISKVLGCGIPALFVGFNMRGATRVGLGMLPRGEVALIIAGVGIANGVIQTDMFGVAILLTLVTTLMAPPALVPAFQIGGPGTRAEAAAEVPAQAEGPFMVIHALSATHQGFLRDIFLSELQQSGFHRVFSDPTAGVYEIEKGGNPVVLSLREDDFAVAIDAPDAIQEEVRTVIRGVGQMLLTYRERIMGEIEERGAAQEG